MMRLVILDVRHDYSYVFAKIVLLWLSMIKSGAVWFGEGYQHFERFDAEVVKLDNAVVTAYAAQSCKHLGVQFAQNEYATRITCPRIPPTFAFCCQCHLRVTLYIHLFAIHILQP